MDTTARNIQNEDATVFSKKSYMNVYIEKDVKDLKLSFCWSKCLLIFL